MVTVDYRIADHISMAVDATSHEDSHVRGKGVSSTACKAEYSLQENPKKTLINC